MQTAEKSRATYRRMLAPEKLRTSTASTVSPTQSGLLKGAVSYRSSLFVCGATFLFLLVISVLSLTVLNLYTANTVANADLQSPERVSLDQTQIRTQTDDSPEIIQNDANSHDQTESDLTDITTTAFHSSHISGTFEQLFHGLQMGIKEVGGLVRKFGAGDSELGTAHTISDDERSHKVIKLLFVAGIEGTGHHLWLSITQALDKAILEHNADAKKSQRLNRVVTKYYEDHTLPLCLHFCFYSELWNLPMDKPELKPRFEREKLAEETYCECVQRLLEDIYEESEDGDVVHLRSYSYPFQTVNLQRTPDLAKLALLIEQLNFQPVHNASAQTKKKKNTIVSHRRRRMLEEIDLIKRSIDNGNTVAEKDTSSRDSKEKSSGRLSEDSTRVKPKRFSVSRNKRSGVHRFATDGVGFGRGSADLKSKMEVGGSVEGDGKSAVARESRGKRVEADLSELQRRVSSHKSQLSLSLENGAFGRKVRFDLRIVAMRRQWVEALVSACIHRFGACEGRALLFPRLLSELQSQLLQLDPEYWVLLDYDDLVSQPPAYAQIIDRLFSLTRTGTKTQPLVASTLRSAIRSRSDRKAALRKAWNELATHSMQEYKTVRNAFYTPNAVGRWPLFDSPYFLVTPNSTTFLDCKDFVP